MNISGEAYNRLTDEIKKYLIVTYLVFHKTFNILSVEEIDIHTWKKKKQQYMSSVKLSLISFV